MIAGSFKQKENADKRAAFLQAEGVKSVVVKTNISGETWYRVQAGAYSNRTNAETHLQAIQKVGIADAYLIAEISSPTPNPDPQGPAPTPILGPTYLSPEHMNLFVKSINPSANELGSYYLTFGEYYEIRGDIAFAQAIKETNYFRFTGIVKEEQNNFAGIGATGPSNPGAYFKTPEEGVLAHLQHLFAYATSQPLPDQYPLVDPRFHLVKRGIAPSWTNLNGKWAVPGTNYGESILTIYGSMIAFAKQNLGVVQKQINQ